MTYAYAPRCRWWSPPEPTHNNGPRPAWDPECRSGSRGRTDKIAAGGWWRLIGESGPHWEDVGGKRRRGERLWNSQD